MEKLTSFRKRMFVGEFLKRAATVKQGQSYSMEGGVFAVEDFCWSLDDLGNFSKMLCFAQEKEEVRCPDKNVSASYL